MKKKKQCGCFVTKETFVSLSFIFVLVDRVYWTDDYTNAIVCKPLTCSLLNKPTTFKHNDLSQFIEWIRIFRFFRFFLFYLDIIHEYRDGHTHKRAKLTLFYKDRRVSNWLIDQKKANRFNESNRVLSLHLIANQINCCHNHQYLTHLYNANYFCKSKCISMQNYQK